MITIFRLLPMFVVTVAIGLTSCESRTTTSTYLDAGLVKQSPLHERTMLMKKIEKEHQGPETPSHKEKNAVANPGSTDHNDHPENALAKKSSKSQSGTHAIDVSGPASGHRSDAGVGSDAAGSEQKPK